MVKGAFREKNNYQGNIDLMVLSRITIAGHKRKGLAMLRNRELLKHYPRVRKDMKAFASAALMGELLCSIVQERQQIRGLFSLVTGVLDALQNRPGSEELAMFVLQGRLLKVSGYEPVLDRCVSCSARPSAGNLMTVVPGRGGIVCRRCIGGEKDSLRISWNASQLIYKSIYYDPLRVDGQGVGSGVIKEVWSFYQLFFQYFLEKKINSYAFIRGL